LQNRGYYVDGRLDSSFGDYMESEVKRFQTDQKMNITKVENQGVIGPNTCKLLSKSDSSKQGDSSKKDCYLETSYKVITENDDYSCGPTSSTMALSSLGVKTSREEMIKLEHTGPKGTGHADMKAGIEAAGRKQNVNLQVSFENFSDVGWENLGKLIADPNIAVICHGHTSGWRRYYKGNYGHYVFPVEICMKTEKVKIADPSRDLIYYPFTEFAKGLSLIDQPSLLEIRKTN
jgi:hypothetical protein